MLKRLRIKFVCVNMAIVLAMLAVIFSLVLGSTRRSLERESLSMLRTAMEQRERPFFLREHPESGEGEAQTEISLPYIRILLNPQGEIDRVEGSAGEWTAGEESGLDGLAATVCAMREDSGVLLDYGLRYLRGATPMGTTVVLLDMSSETRTMQSLIRSSLIVGAAGVAVFLLISILLARWAVRPVENAWRSQRRFVSDASHELKTPLTVIMTNAELLQSPDYDAPARARFTENIVTMSRQMRALVERLLELARVENGAVRTVMEDLDLSALCAEAALPFEPLCFEAGLTLETEITPGVRVHGSPAHLRQVIEIMLDNARKYADGEGSVTLRLRRSGNKCALSVANDGPPIAPEDLPKLFERFYRADKARARDGSYGLGLAIARQIVTDHRGSIRAESDRGVNTFTVTLPALKEESGS